jgi:hypothetical protein
MRNPYSFVTLSPEELTHLNLVVRDMLVVMLRLKDFPEARVIKFWFIPKSGKPNQLLGAAGFYAQEWNVFDKDKVEPMLPGSLFEFELLLPDGYKPRSILALIASEIEKLGLVMTHGEVGLSWRGVEKNGDSWFIHFCKFENPDLQALTKFEPNTNNRRQPK